MQNTNYCALLLILIALSTISVWSLSSEVESVKPIILHTLSVKLGVSTGAVVSEDGLVVVSSTGWQLYCYDIISGDRLWKKNHNSYSLSEPILMDDTILLSVGHKDKKLVAYDIHTGEEFWIIEDIGGGGDPVVYESSVIFTSEDYIISLNPTDGEILWQYPLFERTNTKPVVHKDTGYFTTLMGNLIAIDLNTGEELFTVDLGSPVYSSPVSNNNLIYIALHNGNIISFDINDKQQEQVFNSDNPIYTDLLHNGDNLYFITIDGVVNSLNKAGELVWSYEVEFNVDSSPVLHKGQLIFGADDGTLRSLDNKTGKRLWKLRLWGEIKAKPAVYEDKVLVGTMKDKFYIIELQPR